MNDLFSDANLDNCLDVVVNTSRHDLPNQSDLGQYFTPSWAASVLVSQFFPHLNSGSFVVEPTCGEGAFLNALPALVPAVGVELDADIAARAREFTGRTIYNQSILGFKPPEPVTAMVGNPPFSTALLTDMLGEATNYMVDGGQIGLVLSAHMLQTTNTVCGWSRDYSINSHILPRDIYKGLSKPLCFTIFTKESQRTMVGLALFFESSHVKSLHADIQRLFTEGGKGSVWGRVVEQSLLSLGGTASLSDIYRYVESHRPTDNAFWKEKVRQVARKYFNPIGRGVYAHPNVA